LFEQVSTSPKPSSFKLFFAYLCGNAKVLKTIREKYRFAFAGSLVAFFIALSGIYLSFEFERLSIRHEVRTKIKSAVQKSELDLLVFHKNDLNKDIKWKHDEEFEWQGEMYDIIYKETDEDSLYYWCWADYEESELNQEMQNWIAHLLHDSPDSQKRNQTIKYNYKNLFLSYPKIDLIRFIKQSSNLNHFCYKKWSLDQNPPPLPPPEFSC
jgi:hypothetical protein